MVEKLDASPSKDLIKSKNFLDQAKSNIENSIYEVATESAVFLMHNIQPSIQSLGGEAELALSFANYSSDSFYEKTGIDVDLNLRSRQYTAQELVELWVQDSKICEAGQVGIEITRKADFLEEIVRGLRVAAEGALCNDDF
ncbi:MAG: hypothetical protein MK185_06660 [Saccharospirillaceae bacterium]|nr:hypothetical protein [Saccharospirillaceae bacterium]